MNKLNAIVIAIATSTAGLTGCQFTADGADTDGIDSATVVDSLLVNDDDIGIAKVKNNRETASLEATAETMQGILEHLRTPLPEDAAAFLADAEADTAGAVSLDAISGAAAEFAKLNKPFDALALSLAGNCSGQPSGPHVPSVYDWSSCGSNDGWTVRSGLQLVTGDQGHGGAVYLVVTVQQGASEQRLMLGGVYTGFISVGGAVAGLSNIYDISQPSGDAIPAPRVTFELAAFAVPYVAAAAQAAIIDYTTERAAFALAGVRNMGDDYDGHIVAAWADSAAMTGCDDGMDALGCANHVLEQLAEVDYAATYVRLTTQPCKSWGVAQSDETADASAAAKTWHATDYAICQ